MESQKLIPIPYLDLSPPETYAQLLSSLEQLDQAASSIFRGISERVQADRGASGMWNSLLSCGLTPRLWAPAVRLQAQAQRLAATKSRIDAVASLRQKARTHSEARVTSQERERPCPVSAGHHGAVHAEVSRAREAGTRLHPRQQCFGAPKIITPMNVMSLV